MLQYALLHLFGYAVSIDDLKNFRVSTIDDIGLGQDLTTAANRLHYSRSP
jgi:transketolase